jgi:hypothetical protein
MRPLLKCNNLPYVSLPSTVIALKSRYYLDGKKATLISSANGIRMLACVKARGV